MAKRKTGNGMAKRKTDNGMAKRKTDNGMAKRKTDNGMAKRKTDNGMAKRKTDNGMANRTTMKGQIMIYKPLHRTLKIEQHEFHKNSELDFPERLSCFCSTSGTRSVTLVAYTNAPFYNN